MKLINLIFALFLFGQSLCQPGNLILHMDSVIESNMAEFGVSGGSYALVKNGEIIHISHLGYQDREYGKQVDEETLFLFGSISKLITTVAVLQLCEQEKVSLDEDIRTYLSDFPLTQKVTMRNLLTHTAGFEETVFERVKLSENDLLPFKTYMYEYLPKLILKPGESPAYSNYGMSLAGLIVQEVSGIPYEEYVQQNIFDPLHMDNSSFAVTEEIKNRLAQAYGEPRHNSIEYVQTVPASMLVSTAKDMAKFIAFQIRGNEEVLESETLDLMQKTQYQAHDRMWGRCFGFFEKQFRGARLLEHGGSRNGFYSHVVISPIDSLGLVVVSNGGDQKFRDRVSSKFSRYVYPKKTLEKTFSEQSVDLMEFEGVYYSNRRIESGFGRLFLQAGFVDKIRISSRLGGLHLLGFEYALQSQDQFDISNDTLVTFPISFKRDEKGDVKQLFLPGRSDSYSKLAWSENEKIALATLTIALLAFLTTLIRNVRYLPGMQRASFKPNEVASFRSYASIYCILNLLFLISLAVVIMIHGESFQYKLPTILYVIFASGISGSLVLLILLFVSIKNRIKWPSVTFLAVSIIYTLQLYNWNLLGFHF